MENRSEGAQGARKDRFGSTNGRQSDVRIESALAPLADFRWSPRDRPKSAKAEIGEPYGWPEGFRGAPPASRCGRKSEVYRLTSDYRYGATE